jgi:NADH dehydrogenase FAD-containing subunit
MPDGQRRAIRSTLRVSAPAAIQMGAHAARMIARTLSGQPRQPFRYWNKGLLAVIGRGRAVAEFEHFSVTGVVAWFLWLTIHIAYLAGFRNRASVLLEWALRVHHVPPGRTIDHRGSAVAIRFAALPAG